MLMIRKISLIFWLIVTLLTVVNSSTRPLLNDWVLDIDDGIYPAYVPSTVIELLIKNTVLP